MSKASPHGKHSARSGTARGDRVRRELPKSHLAYALAGESMLVFTCSFPLFICDAQHHTGKLKERRGAVESPARLTVSLCQGQQGLASLLPSSRHLAAILKKPNPAQLRSNICSSAWKLGIRSGAPLPHSLNTLPLYEQSICEFVSTTYVQCDTILRYGTVLPCTRQYKPLKSILKHI